MSEILVNKLTGTSTAGSILVTSEGGAATMQLQQGLAKAWVNFDGTAGSLSARDSLNSSSLTDNGTGDYTVTHSSSMGNANYMASGFVSETGSTGVNDNILQLARSTNYSDVITSTFIRLNLCTVSPTATDRQVITAQVTGDLA
jgi:hypothetical protein